MTATLRCDLCVIGAGAGGLTLAAGAARMGARVVLIEQGELGGDCLYTGCVPSKALLAAAAAVRTARRAQEWGVLRTPPGAVDWQAVRRHLRRAQAAIAQHDRVERFEALGVRVLRARARFSDPRTIEAGGVRVRARRFVLATGSQPAILSIAGLERVPFLTNETIFDLPELPRHLLVLGAGPQGCELAQAFARLGSRVTLVEAGAMLGREDPDLVAPVRQALSADGIEIREQARVLAAEPGPVLVVAGRTGEVARIAGSHLLVATGRRPTVDGLALERAGIAFDATGIRVDSTLRTTNPRVFAVGDVTGGPPFTHAAAWQAGIVLRRVLLRMPVQATTRAMLRVTYTDPELAWVGGDRRDLEAEGGTVQVLDLPFAQVDRAWCEGRSEGLLRLLLGPGRRVLAVGIVGPQAGELLLPWCLLLARRLPLAAMATAIAPYPTLSLVSTRAAQAAFEPLIASPWVRRLVRLLHPWG